MFDFDKYEKDEMLRAIKVFYKKERDEEIGDLAAMLILDFFEKNIGKFFYNRGVRDAQKYIGERLEEMYEIEK